MKILLLSLVIFTFLACDPPRQRRSQYPTATGQNSSTIVVQPNPTNPNDQSGNDGSGTGSGNNSVVPSYLSHCRFSTDGSTGFDRRSDDLGQYTLCRHIGTNDVYFQVQNVNTNAQTCFIPTGNVGQSSTFIGEPRCLNASDPLQVYKISLYVNRTGFESAAISGVTIIKDQVYNFPAPYSSQLLNVDAYLICMNQIDTIGDYRYCQVYDQFGRFTIHNF